MAIQMNVSGLRRNLKNIAHNYTDAQVKVREATSNDPWGPSSTLMSEISDMSYNVVAFSEIMQMVWKRLNDHGRNWRHVYKALVLLDYLIKTGSEKIAEQCKENIFAIQTLKDFQYLEENKDMGMNVREKAKTLVSLLKDDDRLRNERVRALKAKERFAQSVAAVGSDSEINSPSSPSYPDTFVKSSSRQERQTFGIPEGDGASQYDLENARPQTIGEEELQLQLALAMSKEEADQEDAKKRSDDVRLQMALKQSNSGPKEDKQKDPEKSALKDLLDINFTGGAIPRVPQPPTIDPWGGNLGESSSGSMSPQNVLLVSPPPQSQLQTQALQKKNDPWSSPANVVSSPPPPRDPWDPVPQQKEDPWMPKPAMTDSWAPAERDPFAPIPDAVSMPTEDFDEFSVLSRRMDGSSPKNDLSDFPTSLRRGFDIHPTNGESKSSKSPTAFLGENSALVNLDNLVGSKPNQNISAGKKKNELGS